MVDKCGQPFCVAALKKPCFYCAGRKKNFSGLFLIFIALFHRVAIDLKPLTKRTSHHSFFKPVLHQKRDTKGTG
jgi:hypothetical protein